MYATDEWIQERTGAHRTTIARWRASRQFPPSLVQLAELELHGRVELIHTAWTGFRLDARDGTLWTPGDWPCRPGDILAIQYRQAQLRELARELVAARSVTPERRSRLPVRVRQIVDVDEALSPFLAHAHAAKVQRERLADEIERLRTADA